MRLRTAGLIVALSVAPAACGSSASTSTNVTAPASARCDATISNSSGSFGAPGGSGTLAVTVARECSWRATTPVNWITFTSATEGQGDGTVSYRVAENAEPLARQASLVVAERQVALAQAAAPCQYIVSAADTVVADTGGDTSVSITAHQACSWTARSDHAWASVTPTSGAGNGRITVSVAVNSGGERPVSVSVAGQQVTIMQRAVTTLPPTTPTPPPTIPTPPPPTTPTPPPTTPTPPPTDPAPPPTTPTPPPTDPTPPPPTTPTPPQPVGPINLSGVATGIGGSCPALTFSVAGKSVYTTNQTDFSRGSCRRLADGITVDVEGILMSDGSVRADRVRLE